MPPRIAAKEYDVLRRLEDLGLPAVRPAGLVAQPGFDTAILLTCYLEGFRQYRRLFMRLPPDQPTHRARLFGAMASLLVELHRHGVFWGDCSLANTLFSRDGQVLQAWLVDAETSEVHPKLSRGQRQLDLQILVENVAMGMIDLAERLGRPPQLHDTLIREAQDIEIRYDTLWEALHAEPMFGFTDRYRVEGTIRRLNDLGFAVDEVSLQPLSAPVNCGCVSPWATAATTPSTWASSRACRRGTGPHPVGRPAHLPSAVGPGSRSRRGRINRCAAVGP